MPDSTAKIALVITTIAAPNNALRAYAGACRRHQWPFIVVGDEKSPPGFVLEGCDYYDLPAQRATGLAFAQRCPVRHYARKNIGYLLAMRAGAKVIIETDDDNQPHAGFWSRPMQRRLQVPVVRQAGWINVYRYFSQKQIWPRGFPLELVRQSDPLPTPPLMQVDCPIQQGLADDNPDVDAVYRLIMPLPQKFRTNFQIALSPGAWCPVNSQNTTWWSDAFPLLYLPACCSFRMTDIWRGFVAQRIAWANGWVVLFHEPTVWQERNEHDLLRDFQDEVPGYLNNARIATALNALPITPGKDRLGENLLRCYEKLVQMTLVDAQELELLADWLNDVKAATAASPSPS